MKIIQRLILFSFLYLTLFICSCTDKKISLSKSDYAKLSVDSAIEYSEGYPLDIMVGYINEHFFKNTSSTILKNELKIIKHLETKGKKENNYHAIDRANALYTNYYLRIGQLDSADYYSKECIRTSKMHDSINIIDCVHTRSVYSLMADGMEDSAQYYLKLGYKLSEERKDENRILIHATNLGTYYFNKNLYNLAQKMFIRAIEISVSKSQKNPMIYNNIISCMTAKDQYQEASKFWDEHKDILQMDTQSYQGQVIASNRIFVLQNTGRFQEAHEILNMFTPENTHPGVKKYFLLGKIIDLRERRQLNSLTVEEQNFIENNLNFFIGQISSTIKNNLNVNFFKNLVPKLENKIDSIYKINPGLANPFIANSFEIIGNYYANINSEKSIYYFKKSLETNSKIEVLNEEIENTNIAEITDLAKTFTEIQKRERIIQEEKQKRIILTVIIISFVIVSLLLFGIYYKNSRIKLIKSEQVIQEKESLEKEKELSNRIVEYSKHVINNNQELKSKLNLLIPQVSDAVGIQIRQIQREIESLNRVNIDENPQIANAILMDRNDLNEKYPGFEELNKTEKRIFALVEENYKTKDISTLVGVSVQYVRNVKTRIRKKLELESNWGA